MSVEPDHPHGEVFLDARGEGRALRLTWHRDSDLVVLSLWRDKLCAGTFRLALGDVSAFVDALVDGLRDLPSDFGPGTPKRVALSEAVGAEASQEQPDDEGFVDWAMRTASPRASA